MDTSWIDQPLLSNAYTEGVQQFIEFAKQGNHDGLILCPCIDCKVKRKKRLSIDEVENHLFRRGFWKLYKDWIFHGPNRGLSGDEYHEDMEDDEENDVSSNGSNSRSWSNLSFDENEALQIIDANSNIRVRKGVIPTSYVWCLEKGDKIKVLFNKYKQPIGKGGQVMVRCLGDIAKTGELVPLGAVNWHKVEDLYKVQFVTLIHDKFVLPEDSEIDEKIVRHVGEMWRNYRHYLKRRYFEPVKSQEHNAKKVIPNVNSHQWVQLVSHWFSGTGKKLSEIGKRSRAEKSHHHTTGAKSYAQKRHEFKKANKREPSNLEFIELTHKKSDGTYPKDTDTKQLLDTAKGQVAERMEKSPGKSMAEVENIVFGELMYDNENPKQRPIGFGHGVTRNEVFGLKAQLRNLRHGGLSDTVTREEFDEMMKKNAELEKTCKNMASTISRFELIFQRYGIDIDGQSRVPSSRSVDLYGLNRHEYRTPNPDILRDFSIEDQVGTSRRSRNTA